MALATNLTHYWKFDESSGNASDSVGSTTLTNTNTVTYVAGKNNNCANFVAASTQYFTFTPLGLSNTTFTISGWFYQNTNKPGIIYHEGVSGNNNPYVQIARGGVNGEDWVLIARDASAVGLADQWASALTYNVWHHFVWTMTTTQSNLYVDGVLIRTTNFTANSFTANVGRIGDAKRVSEEGYYDGKIDEIAVWSRTLTADEASQVFNSGRGNFYTFTDTPALYGGISYWKLDESSGNATDSIGANTFTNAGTTAFAAAKINNGADLNGSSQYFYNSTPYTISRTINAWIKLDVNNAYQEIFGFDDFTDANNYNVSEFRVSNTGKLNAVESSVIGGIPNDCTITSSETLSTATWYMVTLVTTTATTSTSTSLQLYINGSKLSATCEASRNRYSWTPNTGDVSIGDLRNFYGTPNAYYLNGIIDEVGLWSRALTDAEVTTLYNGGSGLQYPFSDTVNNSAFFNFF